MTVIKTWLLLVVACGLTAGCSTVPVIGPFSYMTAELNDRADANRAIERSAMSFEKKVIAVRAVNLGMRPNEVAVGVGVDFLAFMDNTYTTGEVLTQLLGCLGDLGLYTGAVFGAKKVVDGGGGGKGDINIYNSGTGNRITIDNSVPSPR